MPHASVTILRMTMFAAQSAPAFVVRLDSTSRHAPSRPTLYPPLCVARRATLSRKLSRNPCSTERSERLQESLSTNEGTSARSGHQLRRRQSDESGDITRSKSNAFWLSSVQMTTTHPIPAPGLRRPTASRTAQASRPPFFNPSRDRVTRDAEGPRKPSQTAALVIGAKYSFAFFFGIGIGARLLAAALLASAAQVTLSAISGQSLANQICTGAVLTS